MDGSRLDRGLSSPEITMSSVRTYLLATLLLAQPLTTSVAVEPLPVSEPSALRVDVPRVLRGLALPLADEVLQALRDRDHESAVVGLRRMDTSSLLGSQRSDHAFLLAWSMVRAGQAAEARDLLDLFSQLGTAPVAYRALVRGEVLAAAGEVEAALEALEFVDDGSVLAPRSWVVRAELLREVGRLGDASDLYASIVERPDPIDGNSFALVALAKRRGLGSDKARPLLERVYAFYPSTAESREAKRLLDTHYRGWTLPSGLKAHRAERLMYTGQYDRALEQSVNLPGVFASGTEDDCRTRYVRGRSYYKRNKLSSSIEAFGDVGKRCAGVAGAYGHRALYLKGMAQFRKGQYASSAATYRQIPDLYADTSYADDGLTRSGIALFEDERLDEAIATWRLALERYPDGDTVPEATFRLAFTLYDAGRTDQAIAVARKLMALDPHLDPVHVIAGQYWSARWQLYPDVSAPSTPSEAGRQAAVQGWRELVEAWPHDYYAVLAWSRLREEAPEVAEALASRPRPVAEGRPWSVRTAFFNHTSVGYGVSLARLGMVPEALAEWARVDLDGVEPDERAWLMELQDATGDWLYSFKLMHRWMRTHPAGTLGGREPEIVRQAYPDHYWKEVQEAAAGFGYEPRTFHAIVREESNFDRKIKSHAGAVGLSQLMPATARSTAGWMGRTVNTSDLIFPEHNLPIGARYFDYVYDKVGQDPMLAMASYNAGPGRVVGWASEWDQPPLDEFVERIPFRETRGYVKRVSTSWQTMRYAFDVDAPPFPDLSRFNHSVAVP